MLVAEMHQVCKTIIYFTVCNKLTSLTAKCASKKSYIPICMPDFSLLKYAGIEHAYVPYVHGGRTIFDIRYTRVKQR